MAKIWDILAESIKHNERVIQLNKDITALAKEMREAHTRLTMRDNHLAERIVRLETFVEIAERQRQLGHD